MISRLGHLFFDNILLKLAALMIAVLMWYGVSHDPVAEIAVRVPIEFSHPPADLDYNPDVLPQANLRLRGPARLLRELPQESVHAVIDLQNAAPGERTYDLTPEQIRVPHDVAVMQVTPGRLRLVFDTRATRQIPVHPRVVGTPPSGYRMAKVSADPAMLTISGPSRHVEAVESAITDPVDVSNISGHATFERVAYVPDPLVHVVGASPVLVVVTTEHSSSKAGAP